MKEYTNSRGRSHQDLIVPIVLIAVIAGFAYPGIQGCIRETKYRLAEQKAQRVIGDKKAPLSDEEKAEWYKIMSIKKGEEPTTSQLEKFMRDN